VDGPTAQTDPSRRTFLALAATGALAGTGASGVQAQSQPETIRLGGKVSGWQGRAPERIAGETNPSLELETGQDYRIVWENIDGLGHNLALLDDEGEVIKRTDVMSEQGETQTLTFTATDAMSEYVCQPHITSMHGSISFEDESTTETQTPQTTEEPEPYIPEGASVRVDTVADDERLAAPLGFEVPPDETDRQFIVDRLGQVYVLEGDGLREEPFIDVSDQLPEISGEIGLLGLAFHPNFRDNRRFYLRYSAPPREGTPEDYSHTEVLAEFEASEDGSTALPETERPILEIPSPQDQHNAGAVLFGPDGYLYMAMGDGGGGADNEPGHVSDWYERNEGGNGQDVTENLLGSILRIDVDREENGNLYAIPEDNPLVGQPGLPEHYAWGFRNPWRMSFNGGRLFVADVGQALYEEVNIVEKGKNYGWNVREGTHCFDADNVREPPATCPDATPQSVRGGEPLVDPIIEYPHRYEGQSVGSAAIGGYVYKRSDIPAIQNKYVFADFRTGKDGDGPGSGTLYAATPSDEGLWDLEQLVIENSEDGLLDGYPPALGRDRAGNLYVLTQTLGSLGKKTGGAVHRIRPPENARQTSEGNTTASTTTENPTATNTANTTTVDSTSTTPTAPQTAPSSNMDATTVETPAATSTETSAGASMTTNTTDTTTENGEASTGTSEGSGPGFGVFAALAGLSISAARLLTGSDNRTF